MGAIEAAAEKLTEASHKLAEVMYAAAAQAAEGGAEADAGNAESAQAGGPEYVNPEEAAGDDTVDADFTVVDDEDEKQS